MRTEVVELKRACFCFPLRYSLLIYGYSRLISVILDLFLIVFLTTFEDDTTSTICFKVFSLTMSLLDFILVIIFIVGAHKKSVKLLKTFYFYDLGLLILNTLMFAGFVIYILKTSILVDFKKYFKYNVKIILSVAAYLFLCLGLQGYVLLLVRSEIIKLDNNSQFRFVNNAAESECTMAYNKTGDEEEGLAKNDNEPFEIKDNMSDSISKLENKAECNMKYKKLGDADNGTEKLNNEENCKSENIS